MCAFFDTPQTSMVSVEGLAKLVDPSQLTDDFEGSLDYNHEEWMDLRVSLEEFMSNAVHLLSRLEDLQVSTCINVLSRPTADLWHGFEERRRRGSASFRSSCPRRTFPRTWKGLVG